MDKSKERVKCPDCGKEMARGSLGRHLKVKHQMIMKKFEGPDQLPSKKTKKAADEKSIDADQMSVAETIDQQESLIDFPSAGYSTKYNKDNVHIGLVEYISAIERVKKLAKENLEAIEQCIALHNAVYVKNLLSTTQKKFNEITKLIPAKTDNPHTTGIHIDLLHLDIDLIGGKGTFDRDVYIGVLVDTRYLYYYLKLNRGEITAATLPNMKIPIPSVDIQKKLTEWYDARYELMGDLRAIDNNANQDNKAALDAYAYMKQNSGLDLLQ